ncbi:predicted protein [Nematostella vectensis]|uniref:Dedicator of cytokinesis C/D N-terminal domain-containing protein n=1 Tax=Nematostella vectensis TaxID=45351 RepID=A7SUF7_NEMVE|nr:predicted protein [Nematostella vectensis]|eukprot:XP_001624769.1 predicted protein [Nematostella vectensis]
MELEECTNTISLVVPKRRAKSRSLSDSSAIQAIASSRSAPDIQVEKRKTTPPAIIEHEETDLSFLVVAEVPKRKERSQTTIRPKSHSGERALEFLAKFTKSEIWEKASPRNLRRGRSKSPSPETVFLVENFNEGSFEPGSFKEIVQGIFPLNYEDEIVQKRTQILRDSLQDLLLFPQDDVSTNYATRYVCGNEKMYCNTCKIFPIMKTIALNFEQSH